MRRKEAEIKEEHHMGYVLRTLFSNYDLNLSFASWVFLLCRNLTETENEHVGGISCAQKIVCRSGGKTQSFLAEKWWIHYSTLYGYKSIESRCIVDFMQAKMKFIDKTIIIGVNKPNIAQKISGYWISYYSRWCCLCKIDLRRGFLQRLHQVWVNLLVL